MLFIIGGHSCLLTIPADKHCNTEGVLIKFVVMIFLGSMKSNLICQQLLLGNDD